MPTSHAAIQQNVVARHVAGRPEEEEREGEHQAEACRPCPHHDTSKRFMPNSVSAASVAADDHLADDHEELKTRAARCRR